MNATQTRGKVARTSATWHPSLKWVLRYENEAVVAKLMRELKLEHAEAVVMFEDVLKFLWLADKFGKLGPPTLIDKGWHVFILFTMDYQRFCHKYFGRFLHHRPYYPGDPVEDVKGMADRLTPIASEHLGELSANWDLSDRYAERCSGCLLNCTGCRDGCKCPG